MKKSQLVTMSSTHIEPAVESRNDGIPDGGLRFSLFSSSGVYHSLFFSRTKLTDFVLGSKS